jgi:hypothetical protein
MQIVTWHIRTFGDERADMAISMRTSLICDIGG